MKFISVAIVSSAIAVFSGLFPIIFLKKWPRWFRLWHFILLGISGFGLVIAGFFALFNNLSEVVVFATGMPIINFSLHLDALSGFFLSLIGILAVAVACYGPNYLRHYGEAKQSLDSLVFFTGLFLAGMSLVVLANDLFTFVFSWELMSVASYFLVIYQHQHSENRKAGLVYLLMAHLSGLLILAAFSILARFSGGFDFQIMHSVHLTQSWATIAFLLAFFGFGMKAGIVPLHVWLPQAHPVAPSHISALMSGVMLKVAIYGLIRFSLNLLGVANLHWQWGLMMLSIGSLSALFGILYALMQQDLKRLLAYSSVENVGVIFIGLGLSVIFISEGHLVLGALGLIAALYHCLNHALFKSLLFLGAGAVLQHTHEHDLEKMGGLIHRMPQTAFCFLIGCISIAALPPLNGFVSEWLTFQTSLQAGVLHSTIMRSVIPIAAATLALTGALAAACFAKVYGVAFLGKSRTRHVRHAKESSFGMRSAMMMLTGLCLLVGVFPAFTIRLINTIPVALLGFGLTEANFQHWLWLSPISSQVSSYSAILVFFGLSVMGLIIYLLIARFSHSVSTKKLPAWDCGFGGLNSKMQYTATAFAMPIRRVFQGVWNVQEKITIGDGRKKYELHIMDWIWQLCYCPLDQIIQKITKLLSRAQGGNVRIYLGYTFFTLLVLLWIVS